MMYKLKQLKWKLQRLIRGYGDDDLWSFSCLATEKLRKPFKAFVKYQKKHGMGCPSELFDRKNKKNECHKRQTVYEMFYLEENNEADEKTKDAFEIEEFELNLEPNLQCAQTKW